MALPALRYREVVAPLTAKELARLMRRRANAVEPEFRKTTRSLAVSALAFCRQKITELIYAFPVPKRASGKPEWRRTGALRRGERAEVIDAYSAKIVNDVSYALYRHEAGKSGHRPTRYPAHWRDEMVEAFRSIVKDAYALTVRDILRRGR